MVLEVIKNLWSSSPSASGPSAQANVDKPKNPLSEALQFIKEGELDQASAVLQQIPNKAHPIYKKIQANLLRLKGFHLDAIEINSDLKQTIIKEDDCISAASERLSKNNYQGAISIYEEALDLKISPKSPFIYANLAKCYLNLNNLKEAKKYIELALQGWKRNPEFEELKSNIQYLQDVQEVKAKGGDLNDIALKVEEHASFLGYDKLAISYVEAARKRNTPAGVSDDQVKQEYYNKAITYWNKALKKAPQHYKIYHNIAKIFEELGDINQAIENVKIAIARYTHEDKIRYKNKANIADAYDYLSYLYEKKGDFQGAKHALFQASEYMPNDQKRERKIEELTNHLVKFRDLTKQAMVIDNESQDIAIKIKDTNIEHYGKEIAYCIRCANEAISFIGNYMIPGLKKQEFHINQLALSENEARDKLALLEEEELSELLSIISIDTFINNLPNNHPLSLHYGEPVKENQEENTISKAIKNLLEKFFDSEEEKQKVAKFFESIDCSKLNKAESIAAIYEILKGHSFGLDKKTLLVHFTKNDHCYLEVLADIKSNLEERQKALMLKLESKEKTKEVEIIERQINSLVENVNKLISIFEDGLKKRNKEKDIITRLKEIHDLTDEERNNKFVRENTRQKLKQILKEIDEHKIDKDLSNLNLSNLDLKGLDFKGYILIKTKFAYSDLTETNFENVTFGETDFFEANLKKIKLSFNNTQINKMMNITHAKGLDFNLQAKICEFIVDESLLSEKINKIKVQLRNIYNNIGKAKIDELVNQEEQLKIIIDKLKEVNGQFSQHYITVTLDNVLDRVKEFKLHLKGGLPIDKRGQAIEILFSYADIIDNIAYIQGYLTEKETKTYGDEIIILQKEIDKAELEQLDKNIEKFFKQVKGLVTVDITEEEKGFFSNIIPIKLQLACAMTSEIATKTVGNIISFFMGCYSEQAEQKVIKVIPNEESFGYSIDNTIGTEGNTIIASYDDNTQIQYYTNLSKLKSRSEKEETESKWWPSLIIDFITRLINSVVLLISPKKPEVKLEEQAPVEPAKYNPDNYFASVEDLRRSVLKNESPKR